MNLQERQWVIGGIILLMSLIFIGRLFQLQLGPSSWKDYAARITEEREIIDPARGMILDRNGQVLLTNIPSYDLLFTPRQARLAGGLDTLALSQTIRLDSSKLIQALAKADAYASYRPSPILKQIPNEEYAQFSGELWRFPGVQSKRRSIRTNSGGHASHLLGEYRETDREDLDSGQGYHLGDYKGKSGLELQWEKRLRGKRGIKYHLVDVRNDYREPLSNGQFDSLPIHGEHVTTTLDLDLQAYGERLMENKRGAIVAMDPQTGEVLALVSAPSYSTDFLSGKNRGTHYAELLKDPAKPLFNRTMRATYRPGSIFKMIQGLIALDEGVISPNSRIFCNRDILGCHGSHSMDNLEEAIVHSCNPYFHEVMKRMVQPGDSENIFQDASDGLARWSPRIKQFGLGTDLGGHLSGLRSGSVPDTAIYNRMYGSKRWAYSTIYSISIGEGELLTTPVHMANLASIMANRGWFITPHTVLDIGGNGKPEALDSLVETGVTPSAFLPIIQAMQAVVESPQGTGTKARVPGITVCGKTGTVQDGDRETHAVFMAFAPKDNPRIALSVYVENAGSGGDWAAPIASLMIEQYLKGSIAQTEKEQLILQATYPFPEH
jgi:penicillin-binding protein 2